MVAQKIKQSPDNLVNIEKSKFYIIWIGFGKNVCEFIFFFPSRHPQQHICQKSEPSLYSSPINNLYFKKNRTQIGQPIQKLQSFARKLSFFDHRASPSINPSTA